MKTIFFILVFLSLTITGLFYAYFKPGVTKVGEKTFYKDSDLELKFILIHENYPLHYVGPSYSVVCKSKRTADFPELKSGMIDAGWNQIPSSIFGRLDENLDSLADKAKQLYLVKDKGTVVVIGGSVVSVSFDECRSFSRWSVSSDLPDELVVDSNVEYEECLKNTAKDEAAGLKSYSDCKVVKFLGSNLPVIEKVAASNDGSLSFELISSGLKNQGRVGVATKDFGKTWVVRQ